MTLGVYWYFGFPTGLYHFDYFEFRRGLGGHADGPAALLATLRVPDSERLLARLRALAGRYEDVYFSARRQADCWQLLIDGYQLHDYHFHLATEVEKVLGQEQAQALPAGAGPPGEAPLLPLLREEPQTDAGYQGAGRWLSVVGSSLRQHQAETLALRLDCQLPRARQPGFIEALGGLADAAAIEVLYYYDCDFGETSNLMVFFTNGRQGVGGRPRRRTDRAQLEAGLSALRDFYGVRPGHAGGPEFYPRHGPHVERITDPEYVLPS